MFLDLLSSMKLFLKCLTVVSNLEETFERGQVWLRVERIFFCCLTMYLSRDGSLTQPSKKRN